METIANKSISIDGVVCPDRRATPRRKVLKGAVLTFNRGFGSFECTVRNQSENGARLSFGETSGVPNRFDLAIVGAPEPRTARVCWRSATAVGVAID